jgi:protein TonB
LAYIGFGPSSGGVLLDVSEQGLRCQIVGAVVEGDPCHLKFSLPGHESTIEVDGRVVWSNETKQGGGVRLVGLAPEARLELQQWIDEEKQSTKQRKPAPDRHRTADVAKVGTATGSHALVRPRAATKKASRQSATPSAPTWHPVLSTPDVERKSRSLVMTVFLATCIAAAVAVLAAASELKLDSSFAFVGSRNGIAIAAPPTPPVPELPVLNTEPPVEPESESPSESAPPPANGSIDNSAANPAPAVRPEPPATKRSSASAEKPAPIPPAPPAPSRPLSMQMSRPRAANSANSAATNVQAPAVPPNRSDPLADFSALASRLFAVPPPVQPQTATEYRQAQLVSRVEPTYSSVARQTRLQGTVRVSARIGADGVPRSLACIEGNVLLCQMAIDAVRRWRYEPATANGNPVETQTAVTFNFQLR